MTKETKKKIIEKKIPKKYQKERGTGTMSLKESKPKKKEEKTTTII